MSKKSKRRSKAGAAVGTPPRDAPPPRARRVRLYAAALSGLLLLGGGYAATRYEPVRKAVGMRPLLLPAAQIRRLEFKGVLSSKLRRG